MKAGYGNDNYVGSPPDATIAISYPPALTYKFTPQWQIKTEVRQDWQTSTEPPSTLTRSYTGCDLQR